MQFRDEPQQMEHVELVEVDMFWIWLATFHPEIMDIINQIVRQSICKNTQI